MYKRKSGKSTFEPASARGIIIEGVTGSGKSTILRKLGVLLPRSAKIFNEEETFGDLMEEISGRVPVKTMCRRLQQVIEKIGTLRRNEFVILERFHYSYFALIPQWDLYTSVDSWLAEKGFRSVVLLIPEESIENRSLFRKEKSNQWSKDLIDYFGSAHLALQALKISQRRRKGVLRRSQVPSIQIDTRLMDWDAIATKIYNFIFGNNQDG